MCILTCFYLSITCLLHTHTHTHRGILRFFDEQRCLCICCKAGCLAREVGSTARQLSLTQWPRPFLRCPVLLLHNISSSGKVHWMSLQTFKASLVCKVSLYWWKRAQPWDASQGSHWALQASELKTRPMRETDRKQFLLRAGFRPPAKYLLSAGQLEREERWKRDLWASQADAAHWRGKDTGRCKH